MRNTFVNTLIEEARVNANIYVITPDLGFSVLEKFEKEFPERFLNVGIAEANAINIAVGLALSGKVVYVYSIIPFVIMRPFEQIRVNLAYMNTNVRLIGVGAGITYGPAGATHHAIEDIAIMRALPNMTVCCPSDPHEVAEITKEASNYQGPIYFRLAKRGEPIISDISDHIKLGKANYIQKSNRSTIAILFVGNASDLAIEVSNILKYNNIDVDLISMHTIKPFDYDVLETIVNTKTYIFTIEEHSIIGGLGSVVSEYIAEVKENPFFKRFALPDTYSHYVGSQDYIRVQMSLTKEVISREILAILENKC